MKYAAELRKYKNKYKRTLKAWYYDDLWLFRLERMVGYKRKKYRDTL